MQFLAALIPWIVTAIFLLIVIKRKPQEDDSFDTENWPEEDIVRVAVIDNKAYWVYNNTFYEADVEGEDPDFESARPINTMNMPHKELNKLLNILDTLEEN
jgi:hypothetical protein